MNIPLIFAAVVICMLALYIMNRFVKRPGPGSILILIVQFVAATVAVFSLFENVLTTPAVELGIILTGVVLPLPVVLYDHIAFSGRLKKAGVRVSFLEKKEKKKKPFYKLIKIIPSSKRFNFRYKYVEI